MTLSIAANRATLRDLESLAGGVMAGIAGMARRLARPAIAWLAAVAFALGAAAAERELFVGEYRGTFNGLEAALTITPDLRFVYTQERGEVTRLGKVKKEGTLAPTGADTARAGNIRLRWKTKNQVEVRSPYGSGFRSDGAGGGQHETGSDFTLRRQDIKSSRKIKYSLTLAPSRPADACDAEIEVSYLQMHEQIRIDTTIRNSDCAASSGEYVLKVRTANDNGEQRMREFAESWSRTADEPMEQAVKNRHFYDMDGDVRLVRVQVATTRKTKCRCLSAADPSQDADSP